MGADQLPGKRKFVVNAIALWKFGGLLLNDPLHSRKFLAGNNSFVIVANHILGQFPFVPAVCFSQMICSEVFLQHKVALILFVS